MQGHGWALQKGRFDESLRRFVDGGFDRAASVVDGADFAQGTGSLVNNGVWGTGAHGAQERLDNFDFIVSTLREVKSLAHSNTRATARPRHCPLSLTHHRQ